MSQLAEALQSLGLVGEINHSGRLIRVEGERCWVNVASASPGRGYYVWCDDPCERTVMRFAEPVEAILVGLGRAALSPESRKSEE